MQTTPSSDRAYLASARRAAGISLFLLFAHAGHAATEASPTGAANAKGEPPENAVVTVLPFLDVPHSPRIHLDLARAGEPPIPVILDTGIAYSVGAPKAIGRLRGQRAEDGSGIVRNTVLGVEVPFRAFTGITERVADDQWIRFGGNVLKQFVVEIDFATRKVRFLDAEKWQVPAEAAAADEAIVPIADFSGRVRTELTVNEKAIPVAVDTTVTAPAWIGLRNLKLASVHPKTLPVLRPRTGGRGSTLRLYETDTLRIGKLGFPRVPVLVSNDGLVDEFGSSGAAIGLGLLSHFKVRLDLQRGRMWMKRTRTGNLDFFGEDYGYTRASGAFLGPMGARWQVIGLLPDSPAQEAGVQAGDLFDPALLGRSRPASLHQALEKGETLIAHRVDGAEEVDVVIPIVEAPAEDEEGPPAAEGSAPAAP